MFELVLTLLFSEMQMMQLLRHIHLRFSGTMDAQLLK